MKTKYILHGGAAQKVTPENDLFFQEILKDTQGTVTVLLVHLAGKPERKEKDKAADIFQFERNKGEKVIAYNIADRTQFYDQIEKSDIMYFGGGTTQKLIDELFNYENLRSKLSGKIIAGESAGANALSAYSYSKSAGAVLKGHGLVNVAMMPHYTDQHEEPPAYAGGFC